MADIQIAVNAGMQTRLLTAGKYCKDDILVTASSGSGSTEQEDLLVERPTSFTSYANDRITTIGAYTFYQCAYLVDVVCTLVKTTGSSCFLGCRKLENVLFPMLEQIQLSNTFSGCSALTVLKLPSITDISGSGTFNNCSNLIALVLPGRTICNLGNTIGFNGTPIEDGTGYIYVPDDLVEQYKVATNWTTYANQIKGLSEIPEEVKQILDQQEGAGA